LEVVARNGDSTDSCRRFRAYNARLARRPLPLVDVPPACSGLRTILVPPDIVGVARRSPLRVRKRTPWHPLPDGQGTTPRAGQREWFSDLLFVELQDGHAKSAHGTSAVAHVCLGIAFLVFVLTRPDDVRVAGVSPSLVMPAILAPLPTMPPADTRPPRPVDRPQSKAQSVVPAPVAEPAPPPDVDAAAPVDAPSGITPETGAENRVGGVEGGVPGGIPGGVVGGIGSGPPGAPGPVGLRVMRAGTDIKPPRKIKDAKPIYPTIAQVTRTQGTVLIETTIGVDGKVQDARVLVSVPGLDEAALDAVRQWEYEPSLLNGVPVAVTMTVIVKFALQ